MTVSNQEEKAMPHKFLRVLAVALGVSVSAHGQSLGDIARANREKQASASPATNLPAVITNDDLGQDSHGGNAQRPAGSPGNKAIHGPSEREVIDPRVAAQWKRQILAQEDKIATLQGRVDQLNAAIHPEGTAQFNGPYTRYQTTQMERLADVQLQLDEQKKKLAELQDEARRAGMHTTVYDP
jgi:hypothetical protein